MDYGLCPAVAAHNELSCVKGGAVGAVFGLPLMDRLPGRQVGITPITGHLSPQDSAAGGLARGKLRLAGVTVSLPAGLPWN
jgi:hypothetical protein